MKILKKIKNFFYNNEEFFIYQIFYNDATRAKLDSGFMPLDNTHSQRSDWFEFWPIRKFLLENKLSDDAWYGFLSPKFKEKMNLTSEEVFGFIDVFAKDKEVVLFSPGWDQVAYFMNPFEQGEYWHPGLLEASQHFVESVGINANLYSLVTHSASTVFSNYIIAKPVFWKAWLKIANQLFDYIENSDSAMSIAKGTTSYGHVKLQASMKAFIQERLPSILMTQEKFNVVAAVAHEDAEVDKKLFCDSDLSRTRALLRKCDDLKKAYVNTRESHYFEAYLQTRKQIALGVYSGSALFAHQPIIGASSSLDE